MGADAIDVSFVPVKTSTEVNQTLHPVYNILATATLRLASTTEATAAVQYKRSHVLVYSFISVGTVAVIVLVAFVVRIANKLLHARIAARGKMRTCRSADFLDLKMTKTNLKSNTYPNPGRAK